MDVLNWVSDHWILSITFAMIASATYTVPRIIVGVVTANVASGFNR